ncbi:MAG: PilZ domain-containing protein [Acidobacteriota bacterium]|nr:PilZ domain-containing protein [Acidobacteriota bacterium]
MALGEKRDTDRARKRVRVRYGVDALNRTGFTRNVSPTGLYIGTNSVFAPGTTLQVELKIDEQTFTMWARVVWAKKVPPQLAHVLDCGMGVCFIDPDPDWLSFFESTDGP